MRYLEIGTDRTCHLVNNRRFVRGLWILPPRLIGEVRRCLLSERSASKLPSNLWPLGNQYYVLSRHHDLAPAGLRFSIRPSRAPHPWQNSLRHHVVTRIEQHSRCADVGRQFLLIPFDLKKARSRGCGQDSTSSLLSLRTFLPSRRTLRHQ